MILRDGKASGIFGGYRYTVSNGSADEAAETLLPADAYRLAEQLQRAGEYGPAHARFRALGDYRDSAARAAECLEQKRACEYAQAERLMREELYREAEEAFWRLGDYRDSAEQARSARDTLRRKRDRELRELRVRERRKRARRRRRRAVPLLLVALAVGAYFAVTKWMLPELKYRMAQGFFAAGEYEQAKRLFSAMEDYRDVRALLAGDANMRFIGYEGEIVRLGTYPQAAEGADDAPIEWQVLACDGQRALLISRYALETRPYDVQEMDATWENCTLREWLNSEFLDRAFTPDQRACILLSDVDNGRAQGYGGYAADGGEDTRDRIFLLSYSEAWTYFDGNGARMCDVTGRALEQGAFTGSSYRTGGRTVGWWWLRSPGPGRMYTANVRLDGSRGYSNSINGEHGTVRPAMWVDLSTGVFGP